MTILITVDDYRLRGSTYTVEWDYPVLPRKDEWISTEIVNKLLYKSIEDNYSFKVLDVSWFLDNDKLVPLIYLIPE